MDPDRSPGGLLFKLPRQVRDKIYRNLIKGVYRVIGPSRWTSREKTTEELLESSGNSNDRDLTILRLFSATHHEATAVLYTESTFKCHLDFELDQIDYTPSQQALDRVMNVEVDMIIGLLFFICFCHEP